MYTPRNLNKTYVDLLFLFLDEPEERPATSADGDVEEKRENVQFYMAACKQLAIRPVMYAARHINDKHITMKSHPLGTDGARALCIALVVCIHCSL